MKHASAAADRVIFAVLRQQGDLITRSQVLRAGRTMARHSAMSAQGIIVLHFAPSRIRSHGPGVIAELRSAIEAGLRRPPLAIRTVALRDANG